MCLQLLFVPHIPQEPFSCSKGLPGINYPAGTGAGQALPSPRVFLHLFHPFPSFPASRRVGRAISALPGGFGIFGSAAGLGRAHLPHGQLQTAAKNCPKFPPQIPTSPHPSLERGKVQRLKHPPEFLQKKPSPAAQPSCAGTAGRVNPGFPLTQPEPALGKTHPWGFSPHPQPWQPSGEPHLGQVPCLCPPHLLQLDLPGNELLGLVAELPAGRQLREAAHGLHVPAARENRE